MKTSMLISVIVPVYKVEKYLPRCIESILKQTYSFFELLLIDDGSPDRCGQICEEYALRDARIKVLHTQNGGVSYARNLGLDLAKGDYITFVDSDDWIESDMLDLLYSLLQQGNFDLSVCGLQKEDENGNILFRIEEKDTYIKEQDDAIAILFKGDKYYSYQGWVWNKMYKREIIENNHIRFKTNICYSEDRLFIFEYLKYSSFSIILSSLPKYHYVIRKSSAMNIFNDTTNYNGQSATFIQAFEEMFQYACINYSPYIQQVLASNYAFDVLDFYFRYRCIVHQRGMDVELNAIIRKLLPYQTLYERNIYRLFLFHPAVYSFFIRFRHNIYILKKYLKKQIRFIL